MSGKIFPDSPTRSTALARAVRETSPATERRLTLIIDGLVREVFSPGSPMSGTSLPSRLIRSIGFVREICPGNLSGKSPPEFLDPINRLSGLSGIGLLVCPGKLSRKFIRGNHHHFGSSCPGKYSLTPRPVQPPLSGLSGKHPRPLKGG